MKCILLCILIYEVDGVRASRIVLEYLRWLRKAFTHRRILYYIKFRIIAKCLLLAVKKKEKEKYNRDCRRKGVKG